MKRKLWITPAELHTLWVTPRAFYRSISQPGVCTLAYGEFYRGWNEPRAVKDGRHPCYAARVATSIRLHHPCAQLSHTLWNLCTFLEIVQLEKFQKRKKRKTKKRHIPICSQFENIIRESGNRGINNNSLDRSESILLILLSLVLFDDIRIYRNELSRRFYPRPKRKISRARRFFPYGMRE